VVAKGKWGGDGLGVRISRRILVIYRMDKQGQKKKRNKISNKPADESPCGHILYRNIAHYKFIINVPQTLYAAFIN